MSRDKKEFLSDKTLLIWILLSAISSIFCSLVTDFIVYLVSGCWIMFQHQLAGGSCSAELNMGLIIPIPLVLGLIIGTVLTRRAVKTDSSSTAESKEDRTA